MRILIAYLSYSGNTEEIAELIGQKFESETVVYHHIGIDPLPKIDSFDKIFIGTFTWAMGATPDEVKDFVLDVGYKPTNIAVFGSGETQFGGDHMFCRAAIKLAKFYNSPWAPLRIEQSPRGMQEVKVNDWIEGVMADVYEMA